MSTIAIIGGTGYTGANLAREAAGRGHAVVSWSGHEPKNPVDGVRYETGDAANATKIIDGADVLIAALSPRGDLAGRVAGLYETYATAAASAGLTFIVIGGFSSLRPAAGQPRFTETDLPEQFRDEALEMDAFRSWIATQAPAGLNWVFISPAGGYGGFAPGEKTGTYRIGGDVALFTADGKSELSGPDFAQAVLDVIESGGHRGEHISVAY